MIQLPDNLPWVAYDTETSGLHPDDGARVACVALAYYDIDTEEMWSIGLPFDQGERDKFPHLQMDLFEQAADPNLPREDWDRLLRWLREQQMLAAHNQKFDLTMMRAGTRHWVGTELVDTPFWCTFLAQRVLDPAERAGLDATAQRLGFGAKKGLDQLKGWLKQHGYPTSRYDLAPWHVVHEYVVTDAEMCAYLFAHQLRRIEEDDPDDPGSNAFRIDTEFWKMRSLYMMEKRGIGYDADRSVEAAEILERRAEAIEATLPYKMNDAKQYYFGELGLSPDRRGKPTKKEPMGAPSLDEQQVRKWIAQGNVPFVREYAKASKVRRAISMWYRGYPEKIGADGRLRTTFRQGHVRSGRMSVERVQLQAMPKADKYNNIVTGDRLDIYEGVPDVRDLIVPREGHGLWNLDLSQAELRVASIYSRCQEMLRELGEGQDIHSNNTEQVLKVPRDAKDWKLKRDIAKRLTFGGIFMVGPKTFAETLAKLADIHIDEYEARKMVYGWRDRYPEFGVAYELAMKRAETKRNARILRDTPYETLSWFGPMDWPNTAWNRTVQGSLAEFFGMWLAWLEKHHPGYAILTVHDSLLLECPYDEGDQIAEAVASWGADTATSIFGIDMKVDTERYDK